ncbi:hypothetical protein OS493_000759 [Desmophyllum pertusum]|uniref:Uncharacterized protein n=1 Tax=Desmophyllum pertusum TaxID=174260 RepID=A0A9X0A7S4_9CNID|nr:hypothetical protein OS493_000759 [Desmophyllum pertusum]
MKKHMVQKFDTNIESWKSEAVKRVGLATPLLRKSSRSHSSRSFGSSSVSLARAKSQLQYVKEVMEAQMEEERVAVRFNVYEEVEEQGTCSNMEDYNERLAELVPEDTNMGGKNEMTEVTPNTSPVAHPSKDEHSSVKPPPVIQASAKILPVVEAKSSHPGANRTSEDMFRQESPQTPQGFPSS